MSTFEDLLKNLWKHFGRIAELSHRPGREDPVRDYVIQVASDSSKVKIKFYEKDAREPGQRVIVLQKNPSQKSRFILQAHLDMVCTPAEMSFPLHLYDQDGWRKALDDSGRHSTLGADNGIGVATALALLESDVVDGFECFFTVEEETTMNGAALFEPGLLDARTLINLDSDNVNTITYGCAGGIETNFRLPLAKEAVPQETSFIEFKISGLLGGHSAIYINLGRLNAIKTLIHVLKQLNRRYEFNLVNLNGGNAKNAIPIEAVCGLVVNQPEPTGFLKDLENICWKLAANNKVNEPNFSHRLQLLHPPRTMFDAESTQRVLEMLSWLPQGVIKMNPNLPAAVMTSNNLGMVKTDQDSIAIDCFHRSLLPEELERVSKTLETIGNFYGAEMKRGASFLPWVPNEASPILKLAQEIYGTAALVEVTHAGLECGYIYQKYHGAMDCISISPTILEQHSVNERIDINSVTIFLERLTRIIAKMKNELP